MDTVLSVIVSMMRRQFKFVAAICFIFAAVLLWQEGFTAANVVIAFILASVVSLFFVLVWFWSAIFQSLKTSRNANSQEKR